MELLSDIRSDRAPTPSTRKKKKSSVDKEVQCQLPSNTHSPDDPFCECKDVHIISSNDQYNTNFHIKGNNHDVCIGQVFHGGDTSPELLENGAIPPCQSNQTLGEKLQHVSPQGKKHEINGHYHTTLKFSKPQNNSFTFEIQTQNYSPTFQLDASATKEILLSNPEIIQTLALRNAFTLSGSNESEDKENKTPNINANVFSGNEDIHDCLYANRLQAEQTQRNSSNNLETIHEVNNLYPNRTFLKIAPKVGFSKRFLKS